MVSGNDRGNAPDLGKVLVKDVKLTTFHNFDWIDWIGVVLMVFFGFGALFQVLENRGTKAAIYGGIFLAAVVPLILRNFVLGTRGVLEICEAGFRYIKGKQVQTIPYRGIKGVAWRTNVSARFKQQEMFQSWLICLWRTHQFKRRFGDLTLTFTAKNEERADEIEQALQYAIAQIRQQARDLVDSGQAWESGLFTLKSNDLRIGDQQIKVDRIHSVDRIEDKLLIWHGQIVEPIRLSTETPNALVLYDLLRDRLSEESSGRGQDAASRELWTEAQREVESQGFGRELYRQKGELVLLAPIIATFAGIVWAYMAYRYFGSTNILGLLRYSPVRTLLMLAIPVILALGVMRSRGNGFWIYARGIAKKSMLGRTELALKDIVSFDYHAVNIFTNNLYMNSKIKMVFHDRQQRQFAISMKATRMDHGLNIVRDRFARMLGAELYERFRKNGETIPWGKNLQLKPDGLQVDAQTLVPWAQIDTMQIEDGVLHIFQEGKGKSIVALDTQTPNFFPVFQVFWQVWLETAPQKQQAVDEARHMVAGV